MSTTLKTKTESLKAKAKFAEELNLSYWIKTRFILAEIILKQKVNRQNIAKTANSKIKGYFTLVKSAEFMAKNTEHTCNKPAKAGTKQNT